MDFALFSDPTDTLTMIPFETSFMDRCGQFPSEDIADSGYRLEDNYSFVEENGTKAYMKYNFFHKEQSAQYVSDPFRLEWFHYNEKKDFMYVSWDNTWNVSVCNISEGKAGILPRACVTGP